MTRKLAVLLAIVLATFAFADTRTLERTEKAPNGATAGGVVESVNGNLIQLAGGLVTIDATGARINVRGKDASIASIEPGMLVFAALTNADVHANAPLPAATIVATTLPEATLFGPVQSVDTNAKTLTLLGRTIHVTDETSFGGIHRKRDNDAAPSLADILPNHIVQVVAEEKDGKLVATSILLLAPAPPEVHLTRGEVKSIGTDSWVIGRDRGDDITVVVNAQTKIVGSPKVGDTVELLYRVDSSNAFVAISIVKFDRPTPPTFPVIFRFHGEVKLISDSAWVIQREENEQKVIVNGSSKIEPGIKVGDNVEVIAQRNDDGTATALAIMKRRF